MLYWDPFALQLQIKIRVIYWKFIKTDILERNLERRFLHKIIKKTLCVFNFVNL
jgi:hypothetical protein